MLLEDLSEERQIFTPTYLFQEIIKQRIKGF